MVDVLRSGLNYNSPINSIDSMLPNIEQHLLLPAAPRTHCMDKDKIRAMAEFHAAMYIKKETESTISLYQKAERDVAAIWLAFPDLQNERISSTYGKL